MNAKHEVIQTEDDYGRIWYVIQMGNKEFYEEHTTYNLRSTQNIREAAHFSREVEAENEIKMMLANFDKYGCSK